MDFVKPMTNKPIVNLLNFRDTIHYYQLEFSSESFSDAIHITSILSFWIWLGGIPLQDREPRCLTIQAVYM